VVQIGTPPRPERQLANHLERPALADKVASGRDLAGLHEFRCLAAVRFRVSVSGKRFSSPALVADGNHARVDGFVPLGVVASAIVVSLGAEIGDPIIRLAITLVILRSTWQSWRTVTTTDLSEMIEPPH
jgi:Cation efflux family